MKNQRIGNLQVAIRDNEGDIEILKTNLGTFALWIEIQELTNAYWELSGEYKTLAEAMAEVAKIIQSNVDCDFYDRT